jgi:DNA-directed RNA polymerase specialized sigma24 family protein
MIENSRREPLYEGENDPTDDAIVDDSSRHQATDDIERLFDLMPNKRYVYVIRRLILEDVEPDKLAAELGVTVDNLYNIKRRAMSQLTRVALNDIRKYER